MDLGVHEINFLAQAHWHHFQYRIGEMIGLDRRKREVHLAADLDDDGKVVTPPRTIPYDTLIIAIGSEGNDFGTPGVRDYAISLDTPVQAKRFHTSLVNASHPGACTRDAPAAGAASRGDYRRRCNRSGACSGVALHNAPARRLWPDRIDPDEDIKIELIEAADRILPALPVRLPQRPKNCLKISAYTCGHHRR